MKEVVLKEFSPRDMLVRLGRSWKNVWIFKRVHMTKTSRLFAKTFLLLYWMIVVWEDHLIEGILIKEIRDKDKLVSSLRDWYPIVISWRLGRSMNNKR